MQPVLVTGGAGYIGSHTVQALARSQIPVIVLDNLSSGHREAVCVPHFYQGDIADSRLVEHIIKEHGIRSVIHFAARSLVGESFVKPEYYFRENTIKSFAFFDTAIKNGVKNVVFSSTAAVYGAPGYQPIVEETVLSPINPYGASKRMIEEYLEWQGRTHDVRWVTLRYFNAAGASLDCSLGEDHHPETHLIPLVMQTLLGMRDKIALYGSDYPTIDGSCIRDYVHVVDLAEAHVAALNALENGLEKGVFNVGTGKGLSVLEIIKKSSGVAGRRLKIDYEDRRQGDPPVLIADSTSIQKTLGWKPQYSDLETILVSAWNWHSSHPSGF
ncbi:UDP-glucose 4-epimerase GalE [Syntrophomonas palmitatica]|uniref:UDP-glucose 4-epimerase GalE n=1 Tax=Syntrophomonas palmitatica TaxID=402877 RepID=UPI0006D24FF3|nr:UDP-glucose 4-epimerase GalE [Syntrophomonas palmitatica]